jgi:hypothetical protein
MSGFGEDGIGGKSEDTSLRPACISIPSNSTGLELELVDMCPGVIRQRQTPIMSEYSVCQ